MSFKEKKFINFTIAVIITENDWGKSFVNICGNWDEKIVLDENGTGKFYVNDKTVSVWVNEEALKLFK